MSEAAPPNYTPYVVWFALVQSQLVIAALPTIQPGLVGSGPVPEVALLVYAAIAFVLSLFALAVGFLPVPPGMVRLVLRCALAEACGLLGLALAAQGAPTLWPLGFSAWGLLLTLVFFPRPSEFEAPTGR